MVHPGASRTAIPCAWAGGKELISALRTEVRILVHLAGKVDPAQLDYRPTPKQRSTLELLRYIAIMGPTQLALIQAGAFDRPALMAAWSAAEAVVKAMSLHQAVAAIEGQSDKYARLLGGPWSAWSWALTPPTGRSFSATSSPAVRPN